MVKYSSLGKVRESYPLSKIDLQNLISLKFSNYSIYFKRKEKSDEGINRWCWWGW